MTVESVEFLCPFCGRSAAAQSGPERFVAHQEPPCRRFLELDALAYVTIVRADLNMLARLSLAQRVAVLAERAAQWERDRNAS